MVHSSDGPVDRASASGAVDPSLIPRRIKPMILKLVFTAFLLNAQHYRDSEANKPASLYVAPFGKAFGRIPLILRVAQNGSR